MALETRIYCPRGRLEIRMEGHGGDAPLEEGPSYLRLVCQYTVEHATRLLGGGGVPELAAAPAASSTSSYNHLVDDPSDFLDYDRTRGIACLALAALPGLHGLDLAPSNWTDDVYLPDHVATAVLGVARENDDRGLCGGHYGFLVRVQMEVTLVFSEPKALLRHCAEVVMQTVEPGTSDACGICLDSLATSTPPVNLPCGHAFHSRCVTRWLFKGTACPLCRHDLRGLVAAPWAPTSTTSHGKAPARRQSERERQRARRAGLAESLARLQARTEMVLPLMR